MAKIVVVAVAMNNPKRKKKARGETPNQEVLWNGYFLLVSFVPLYWVIDIMPKRFKEANLLGIVINQLWRINHGQVYLL